jgi:hypothetical protein
MSDRVLHPSDSYPATPIARPGEVSWSAAPTDGAFEKFLVNNPTLEQLCSWLRLHLVEMVSPAQLGVLCARADLGVALADIAPAQLPARERIEQLLQYLLSHESQGQPSPLRALANALLSDEDLGSEAQARGLHLVLDDGTNSDVPSSARQLPQAAHPLPVPRSGRLAELGALNAYLQAGIRCIVLRGVPGSGKSALLSRWLQPLFNEAETDPQLAAQSPLWLAWQSGALSGAFYWSFAYDADLLSFLRALSRYVTSERTAQQAEAMATSQEGACRNLWATVSGALGQKPAPLLLILDGLELLQTSTLAAQILRSTTSSVAAATAGVLARGRHVDTSPTAETHTAGELHEPFLESMLRACILGSVNCLVVTTAVARLALTAPFRYVRCVELDLPPLSPSEAVELLRQSGVRSGSDADLVQRGAEHGGHAATLRLLSGYVRAYFDGDGRAVTRQELPASEPALSVAELPPSGQPGGGGEPSTLPAVLRAHLLALSPLLRQILDLCALIPPPFCLSEFLLVAAEIERTQPTAAASMWSSPSLDLGAAVASFGAPPTPSALLALRPGMLSAIWLRDRLGDLARLNLIDLLPVPTPPTGEAARRALGGIGECLIDIQPALRPLLVAEWLRERGGAVVDPRLRALGPLPRGESSLVLLELLCRLLLTVGLAERGFALLSARLGGYLYHVHGQGRGRRFLSLVRQLYPLVASTAMYDVTWKGRYAQLLTWESETLRTLGQLDAALVTAQRQWPLGSPPQPERICQQARVLQRIGKLTQAAHMARLARQAAQSPIDAAHAALELAAIELLRGDTAMCQIYLSDCSSSLAEEPLLLTQPAGAELLAALELLSAQRALRLGLDAQCKSALERCRATALVRHSERLLACCDVAQADLLRRERSYEPAAQALHRVVTYAGRSGDMEMLIIGGLAQTRLRMQTGHLEAAGGTLSAALALAVEHSFGCQRIDLLIARGNLALRRGEGAAAERDARDALAYAMAPGCGYQWGEADALHLLATALLLSRPAGGTPRHGEAMAHLSDELDLRERMCDPAVPDIHFQLRRLKGTG